MPGRRLALLAAAGLLAGGAAAFFVLPRPADSAATTSSTVPATATTTTTWVSPREIRIGPVVTMAAGLQMEGDRVLFTYEVVPLSPGPAEGAAESQPPAYAAAAPAAFTLTYPGGTVSARAVGPTQRSGRFLMPEGFTIDQVEAITIDSYWVAVPLGYAIELSPSSGAWVPVGPGMRARIVRVAEQRDNFLLTVELEADTALVDDVVIAGEGREWQPSSHTQLGGLTWTLAFDGETLPDPVPLAVRGVGWIEVAGGGPVDLEGVPR